MRCTMAAYAFGAALIAPAAALAGPTARALKPRRGFAVAVELAPRGASSELDLLSMQLRKANIASLWAGDVATVAALAAEQASAKGDFPGPCPVVYNGDAAEAEAAAASGASAVVLGPAELGRTPAGTEVLWRVADAAEVRAVVAADAGAAFVVGEAGAAAVEALPAGALAVVEVEAMQAGNAELGAGKALAAAGGTCVPSCGARASATTRTSPTRAGASRSSRASSRASSKSAA